MLQKVKHQMGNFMPALRSRNYRLYFIGQGISLVGTWMQTIAEQWLIYPVLTNNKSLLGIVSAINLAPTLLFVLFAGVMVDRIRKRTAFMLFQIIYALIALSMYVLVSTHTIQIWHIYVAAALTGLVYAFDNPVRQTFMMELVDKKNLPSALSLSSAMFNGARAIGPAMAGILIAVVGIAPAYLANSVSFIFVIGSLFLMKFPSRDIHVEQVSILKGFSQGFSYVKENKHLASLLLMTGIFTFFIWPLFTLLPVFAHDIFNKGELGFGLLQTFFGIGAVISGVTFSKVFERIQHKNSMPFIGMGVVSIVGFLFSWSPWFYFLLFLQLVNGWATAMTFSTLSSLILIDAPDYMRGRMMSFYNFMFTAGLPAGALVSSLGVATIGAKPTVFTVAFMMVVTGILLFFATRKSLSEKEYR